MQILASLICLTSAATLASASVATSSPHQQRWNGWLLLSSGRVRILCVDHHLRWWWWGKSNWNMVLHWIRNVNHLNHVLLGRWWGWCRRWCRFHHNDFQWWGHWLRWGWWRRSSGWLRLGRWCWLRCRERKLWGGWFPWRWIRHRPHVHGNRPVGFDYRLPDLRQDNLAVRTMKVVVSLDDMRSDDFNVKERLLD